MSDIVLKTNGLVKAYKGFYALDGVSLEVHRGDIYGFVGENGAGKTTLIRAIVGLIFCEEGDYELFGVSNKSPEINSVKPKMAGIVESPSIFGNLNALDNLLFQQALIGIENVQAAKDLLELVGLGNVDLKKKVGDFSLGMRQRLAIAMCLVNNPEFLILDEPLNGLDPQGIVEMRNLILELNQNKNITFLISSHILTELALVATRYGIISKGKMLLEISKDEIQSKFRKTTMLNTSDNAKANEIIRNAFPQLEIELKECLYLYDFDQNNELMNLLVTNNINILSLSNKEETFEDYYLQVMNSKEEK